MPQNENDPGSMSAGPTHFGPEAQEVLTVPRDTEYILEQGVGQLALEGVRIQFTPDSKLGPQINGLQEDWYAWPAGMLQGGYMPIASVLEKYSKLADPGEGNAWDRMFLTGKYIGQIVASQDAVLAGQRVRKFHTYFEGVDRDNNPIKATDPEPYTFGWATIMWLMEQSQRSFRPAESPRWWEEWWQEARVAYQAQGVSDEALPTDYGAYKDYCNQLCETQLQRTPVIDEAYRRMLGDIDRPPQTHPLVWKHMPGLKPMLSEYVRLAGIGSLPEVAREAMELPWTQADQRKHDKWLQNYKKWTNLIPPRMRTQPEAVEHLYPPENASHRLQIKSARAFYNLYFPDPGKDRKAKRAFQ